MRTLFYHRIEMKYYPREIGKASQLIALLDNNCAFLRQFLPDKINFSLEDDPNYISDIYEYLKTKISNYFIENEDKINPKMNYYKLLLKKNNCDGLFDIEVREEDNYLYSEIASLYYKNKEDYFNFVFNITDKEKEKIFKFLTKKYQDSVYRLLLMSLIGYATAIEDNYLQVISEYFEDFLLLEKKLNFLQKVFIEKEVEKEVLSPLQLNYLFKEFLSEKDPTGVWLNYYIEGLNKKEITFSEDEDDESYAHNHNMHIVLKHNLDDFRVLAHEFAHYISLKVGNPDILISEIPAIYYEEEALNFLEEKGYDSTEIFNMRCIRDRDFLDLLEKMNPINKDIVDGVTTNKERLNKNMELIIKDGMELITINSYLLAKVILNSLDISKNISKEMYYITNNLALLDIEDIEEILKHKFKTNKKVL